MIRLTALLLFVGFLTVYAWKDWFKSLCGLILLIGIIQHPDMPRNVLGIQGLNPWNIVLLSVFLAWMAERTTRKIPWDLPTHLTVLLILYFGVLVSNTVRMMGDWEKLGKDVTISYVLGEYWINTFKWVVPAFLLFDGARNRTRYVWGILSLVGIYVVLGVQVIKWMPPSNILSGDQLSYRALKILQNEIGFSRVNLSMLLGGGSWAVLAVLPLFRSFWLRAGVLAVSLSLVYAQALTGGRTGYVTWAAVGLLLCIARWRRYLLLVPFVLIGVMTLVPGAKQRMLQGFGSQDALGVEEARLEQINQYEITSGRTLIWPYVIEKIKQRPMFGYGREAMARTGLARQLWDELGESFPHPHNSYLETLFDGGLVGFFCVIPFYLVALFHGFRLFLDSRSPYFVAAGGVLCSLVLALLVSSMGSQTFYPREGSVGMWCAFGLAFRTLVERRRAEGRHRTPAGPRLPRPVAAPRTLAPSGPAAMTLRRHA